MARNQVELNRDRMFDLLGQLNEKCRMHHVQAKLYIIGGGAMAMSYDYSRITTDIDAVVKIGDERVFELVSEVARENPPLEEDWLNHQFTGDSFDKGMTWSFVDNKDLDEATTVFEGSNIVVESASPRMILALKTVACREKDMNDIFILMKSLNIKGYRGLSENLQKYFGTRIFEMQGRPDMYIHPSIKRILALAPPELQDPKRVSLWQSIKSYFTAKTSANPETSKLTAKKSPVVKSTSKAHSASRCNYRMPRAKRRCSRPVNHKGAHV